MKPTMYLIDHENIHSPLFSTAGEQDVIHIFYTNNASTISLDSFLNTSARIMSHKVPVGKQSLDIHLIGHLGYLLGLYGSGYKYSIISHDTDYIRVIDYLRHLTNADISIETKINTDKEVCNPVDICVPIIKKEVSDTLSVPKISAAPVSAAKPCTKSELNVQLIRQLGKILPHPESNQTTSAILKYYGNKNIKMLTYRLLVQKYKQKKGLEIYKQIKSLL